MVGHDAKDADAKRRAELQWSGENRLAGSGARRQRLWRISEMSGLPASCRELEDVAGFAGAQTRWSGGQNWRMFR